MATIDHLILNVNEIASSVEFYVGVLGFKLEGEDGPFTVIRVNDDFTLQLAPWGTGGNEHLAFALSRESFDNTFARMKEKGIPMATRFIRWATTPVQEMKPAPEVRLQRFT